MSNRLFIGLLAAGFALSLSQACGHKATPGESGTAGSGTPGGGGSTGAGNTTGTGNGTGTGDSTGSAGDGSAGTTGAGGSATGTAGSATGTAGSGTGTAGATGTGGSGPSTDMIDNLDDNNGFIIQANGRQGPWHSFNDTTSSGNQQPPLGSGFMPASGGANNTAYAVH